MKNSEPTLSTLEDYNGKESKEKRRTIWVVILSGLLLGVIYAVLSTNSTVSDSLIEKNQTGIMKY